MIRRSGPSTAMLALGLTLAGCALTGHAQSVTPADSATAGQITSRTLGQGAQNNGINVDMKGPLTVTFKRITIPPGASTGRHCHDGNLVAVVLQGTLTHYAPIYPDGVHRYTAGQSLVEGPDYVHEGRNEGKSNVVLLVTYLIPKGKPLAETDLGKCDPEHLGTAE